MKETRWCYIDDCRKPASLVIESHPDDITLCDDHRDLVDLDELQPWETVVAR